MNSIIYSPKENQFYSFLLATNNSNIGSDYINGSDVVKLFLKANLNKDILKAIWDLSSKRKAKDLNKDEFFYACRLITLAQNNQMLTEQNIIKLNNSNLIPYFNGVSFVFQEPKIEKKIEDDFKDDDFIAIDEDPNKQIKEGESIHQAEMNIINAFMLSNPVKKKEEVKNDNNDNDKEFQFVQEEFKPTKKLDDLFGLLGNFDEEKNNNLNNQNNDNNESMNNKNNTNNVKNNNSNVNMNNNMNMNNMNMNNMNMNNNMKMNNMNMNNNVNMNNNMNMNILNNNMNMNNMNMNNTNINKNNSINNNLSNNINNNITKANTFSNINIQGIANHFDMELNELQISDNTNNNENKELPSDDEFVAIEEEQTEKKDNNNTKSNNIDLTLTNPSKNNNPNTNININSNINDKKELTNDFDFNINNSNKPTSISPEPNLMNLETQFPSNNINIKQTTPKLSQPKSLSLDDFMGAFDNEINKENNGNINETPKLEMNKNNDNKMNFNNNQNLQSNIINDIKKEENNFDDDDDDFEEVEEEEKNTNNNEKNERIIPKTINIENKGLEIKNNDINKNINNNIENKKEIEKKKRNNNRK